MADSLELAVQLLGIVTAILVSFVAVLYGANLTRQHEFRKDHTVALKPRVQKVRDEVEKLRRILDGHVEFSDYAPLVPFKKSLQERFNVMPDKLAFQHLVTGRPRLERPRLLLAIQDAEQLLEIRAALIRDLYALTKSESYNFDVNLKTNPGGHASVMMLQLIVGGDPDPKSSLEFRDGGLGLVGSMMIANGPDMGYLHPKIWTVMDKASKQLRAQGGHYPGQESTLLDSGLAWRLETAELHQLLETWLEFGIENDRCELCRKRL